MSGSTPERDNRWIYWALGGVVVVLAVVGLIVYSAGSDDREAQQKAEELTQKFEKVGLPVPADQEIITRSLGNDGGAVCENPANALGKALLNDQITNGASFVGRRPVIIDRRILLGEALILETYCPDELPDYREQIDHFKADDTIEE